MSVWKSNLKELIGDIVSRKFVVFLIATTLFVFRMLSETSWFYIAVAYMATNFVEKIGSTLKGNANIGGV